MHETNEAWLRWLAEGHAVIRQWERTSNHPLLSVAEAALLAEQIARALTLAFERGRAAPN
jgi:hypothetical protein